MSGGRLVSLADRGRTPTGFDVGTIRNVGGSPVMDTAGGEDVDEERCFDEVITDTVGPRSSFCDAKNLSHILDVMDVSGTCLDVADVNGSSTDFCFTIGKLRHSLDCSISHMSMSSPISSVVCKDKSGVEHGPRKFSSVEFS
jgi:hypothetical protein